MHKMTGAEVIAAAKTLEERADAQKHLAHFRAAWERGDHNNVYVNVTIMAGSTRLFSGNIAALDAHEVVDEVEQVLKARVALCDSALADLGVEI